MKRQLTLFALFALLSLNVSCDETDDSTVDPETEQGSTEDDNTGSTEDETPIITGDLDEFDSGDIF